MATLYPSSPNVGSQIERALIAYLKSVFNDAAGSFNFYFSNDWKERRAPAIDVIAMSSTETIAHSRNESYQVRISFVWPGTNVSGQKNPDANWVAVNWAIGVVMSALSVSGGAGPDDVPTTTAKDVTAAGRGLASAGSAQDQVNNADMANFTVEYVGYNGAKRAEVVDGSFYLMEVRLFEVRAGNF